MKDPKRLDLPYIYKAVVTRVVDGDTIDVTIDLGMTVFTRQRIRLANVDAPETYGVKKGSQEWLSGMRVKNHLAKLIMGKNVVIKTIKDKKGKYGRYIAHVYLDGVSVNEHLVKSGLAKRSKK